MKTNYVLHVLEEYIGGGDFDASFGDEWIDESRLQELAVQTCNYAFADYGIDAKSKYVEEVDGIFRELSSRGAILTQGDEYSGLWFRLLPSAKMQIIRERQTSNPVTPRVEALGSEALRRALNKIVTEDGLRPMEEKWFESAAIRPPSGGSEPDASPDPKFFLAEERREKFLSLADQSVSEVGQSDLSNSEMAQARGYLTAARALAEVPDPPVDLIWTILQRANSIAGIASFFVALIALLALGS